jgi:nicotinate-nucleotide--dimethylbenzimidazole phosphoribosyltransferase
VFAGDHGVAAAGVSAHPPGQTVATVREIASGGGSIERWPAHRDRGPALTAVDGDLGDALPPADGSTRFGAGPAGSTSTMPSPRAEAEQAFLAGAAIADSEVDSGATCCSRRWSRGHRPPRCSSALTRSDAAAVTGRGSASTTPPDAQCAIVRDALRRPGLLADQIALLATAGGADFCWVTGLLQVAVRRTPVIVDGLPATCRGAGRAAARLPQRGMVAGGIRRDGSRLRKALDRMGLTAAADLRAQLGPGAGVCWRYRWHAPPPIYPQWTTHDQ